MFAGPSAVAGPTAGAISTNPAAYIPDDGLAIAQVNELRTELSTKHPMLTAAAPLAQSLVNSLSSDCQVGTTIVLALEEATGATVQGALSVRSNCTVTGQLVVRSTKRKRPRHQSP